MHAHRYYDVPQRLRNVIKDEGWHIASAGPVGSSKYKFLINQTLRSLKDLDFGGWSNRRDARSTFDMRKINGTFPIYWDLKHR